MLPELTQWIEQTLKIKPAVQEDIFYTLLVLLGLLLARLVILNLVNRRTDDPSVIYRWRKALGYVLVIIGTFLLVVIWLSGFGSLATYFGLLSAALVIALQDPITNLVGWVFIIWRRPFEVGDRIELAGHAGDVIDLRVFQFTLLELRNWVDADQSTGRILHVPNRKVFSDPIANATKGFNYIWNEMPMLVTYESDWRLAKSLLQDIAERHAAYLSENAREQVRQAARHYMIFYGKLTPIVYTRVVASGVQLTVRYLCDPRQRRSTEQAIWEDILDAFAAEPTIELAYPTQRITMTPPPASPQ
jgi:small-conductance mechanosensitive channel